MYCCSAQENKMDYKRRFLLGGSKQKVPQYQMPELGRGLGVPLGSSCSAPSSGTPGGGYGHSPPLGSSGGSAVADIQQGISKYLDALNAFCRASSLLTELFCGVFRNSRYAKAAMQMRDVQDHVMEAAGRLTAAIKPEIAKMLMELSAGAASFRDQSDFSLQDVEVLSRCFLRVMQVHFQFLSQALQKGQPVAQSCLVEALAQAQELHSSTPVGPLSEQEEASRSWRAAAAVTGRLRERGRDGSLPGLEVRQLFCSINTTIPEHQLKELNVKIDSALQVYKVALDGLGYSEYALKAGFHLDPKAIEESLQGCCSEAEAQQAGRLQTLSQPLQSELPTIPLQIGPHFLKGVSLSESVTDNLKLKMHATLQLIKAAVGQNGVVSPDDMPVSQVLTQVCPSSWRGACKTAVQLLFGQAGLVVVDTAHFDNKEAYAPHITLEESRIVVQVPSTWCLKEDPATMSLLQRSLDPEKTLGLVDVLYTAIFDLSRWRERREQGLPTIQMQLQRESAEGAELAHLPSGNGPKSSGGLPRTISRLTSKLTKKSSSSGTQGGSCSLHSTPSRSGFTGAGAEDKAKPLGGNDSRLQATPAPGSLPCSPEPGSPCGPSNGHESHNKGMNLPTDQEMQDVIDFLSGFNMSKSQHASPLAKRRNSVASASAAELKPPSGATPPTSVGSHGSMQPLGQRTPQPTSQQAMQYYQHLLQPIGQQPQLSSQQQQQQQQQQRGSSKWLSSSTQHPVQSPPTGISPIGHQGQWGGPGLPNLSSDLYSLGLVSSYMDGVISEMLGQKPQSPRNNTWPNLEQSDVGFGALGDALPFDPAVGSDPEFARYVAGVNQAIQQKRQAQHIRRPSNAHGNWPGSDEAHGGWAPAEYYTEREAMNSGWTANQGDSASSSDETSSANGDSLFSMFSGPDLVAAVKQRRKHSCGEQDVCTPSPALHHPAEDSSQDSKMKTWPPKAPWQHPSHHTNTLPSTRSSLYSMPVPNSQWADSMQVLQSTVWSAPGGCSPSSGFPYGRQQAQQPQTTQSGMQQQQQQQAPQHKPPSKSFKPFSQKQEHRPSYLHQY
ncbi:granule associated Rac and RHOG effector protein 1-like [Paramormyrops kingsleyae]|uniref:granule associated Rac and RHOG effector protein 1-like n=1 Tax=Paramormyrops kingsleyae TaxID=1676925 RepID=UPI003B979C0C